jgi:hypothetical protein
MSRLLLSAWFAVCVVVCGGAVGRSAPAALTGALRTAAAADAKPITTVLVRNTGDQAAKDAPITFGQVFRKGDVKEGLLVTLAGKPATAQVDVKRKYDDGSVRFAIVSLVVPDLAARGETKVELSARTTEPQGVGVTAADVLKTDFEAVLTFTFPDGMVRSASARRMLEAAGDKVRTWLAGPVVTEFLLDGPPTDKDGRPDPDLNVQFQVRAYAGGKAVRVSAVVENCWDTWAGNIGYDVTFKVGGREVYSGKDVNHGRLARWRKVAWLSDTPEPLVIPDVRYLLATGALPNYDTSVPVSERVLGQMAATWAKSRTDILQNGSLTMYMPTTGGRPEIGPYPQWTVRYLLSLDPRARTVVLGNGDLAGSWPIHVRPRKTGRILTVDERPKFWMVRNQYLEYPTWQPDRKPLPPDTKEQFVPDCAHQGSFAYVPYLLTGDYYYLEEAYFWGAYCLLAQWPVPREYGKGIVADQLRGDAWALRNIADAGFIAPDGDPEAGYFDGKVRVNIASRIAKMYGPPEFNAIGAWDAQDAVTMRVQNPANPKWLVDMPWQADFMIWSMHHLTELGYADAGRVRDFLLRQRVGLLTNAPDFDPQMGAPYKLVVGEILPDKTRRFYSDWKTLMAENLKLYQPGLPTSPGTYSYGAWMALVCGIDGQYPKAAEAARYLESHLPTFRENLAADPTWALKPRTP